MGVGVDAPRHRDHAVAIEGIRNHLAKFWDPVMRRQLKAHTTAGGDGLLPLAREAVERLDAPSNVAS